MIGLMAERRVPRPANADTDMRSLKTYVPVEKWSEVMDRTEKAGISVSKYLSALIDRDQLDEQGWPVSAASQNDVSLPLPGMEAHTAA